MSILNVVLGAHSALVAVDTAGQNLEAPESAALSISKLYPLVHINALISGRGSGNVLAMVAFGSFEAGRDFDTLAEALPKLIAGVIDITRAEASRRQLQPELLAKLVSYELVLVGWSNQRRRWTCYECRPDDAAAWGVSCVELGIVTSPWDPSWGPWPTPATRAELVAHAQLQTRLARRDAPQGHWGGHLIVAELSRLQVLGSADSRLILPRMTIETACEL